MSAQKTTLVMYDAVHLAAKDCAGTSLGPKGEEEQRRTPCVGVYSGATMCCTRNGA